MKRDKKKSKNKKTKKVYVYGKHALVEALMHAPHTIKRVFLANEVNDAQLRNALKQGNVPVSSLGNERGTKDVIDNEAHQGIIAEVMPEKLVQSFDEFVNSLEITNDTVLLMLGELEDPHNVGAIIRSSAAFGASGVLMPQHNQAPVTGAVVKVSAGMAFRVPLVSVGNVNTALKVLKDKEFWVYGLAGEGSQDITKEEFDRPTVFVLGNEAKGIREKTREQCDILLSIPMNEQCESLNVAASTAVTLYAWSMQHPNALKDSKD